MTTTTNSEASYSINSTSPIYEADCDNDSLLRSSKNDKIKSNNANDNGLIESKKENQSSASTSENDLCIPSISLESSDLKMWIRSGFFLTNNIHIIFNLKKNIVRIQIFPNQKYRYRRGHRR